MRLRLNWGAGVVAGYVVFAAATTSFVVYAANQPIDLVSPDYYAQSLRQDARTHAIENAERLGEAAGIANDGAGHLVIRVPPSHVATAHGRVTLYRPADARADRGVDLAPNAAGRQLLSLDGVSRGQWIVKFEWTAAAQDFYLELPLVIE